MLKIRALALSVAAVTALTLLVGCGGGAADTKTLEDAQAKITALEAKGLPPSELSMAKVHLSTAKEALEKRNNPQLKKALPALAGELDKAQKYYDEQVSTLPPKIDAAKATAVKAKDEYKLTGFQVKKIDSTVAVIDSLKKIDRPVQANNVAQALVALLPSLRDDEAKANSIRNKVPGQWLFKDQAKSVEHKEVNAIEQKLFTFGPGNKAYLVESKKGQSGPFLKEDWEFRSWGTYDFMGDTVMLMINRFQIFKQDFHRFYPAEKAWKLERQPTYDSTITDGSQDRSISWYDLYESKDFKKVK
ncbi:MAG: hypothetical protein FWB85_00155 [Chitinispirillia bacterium]|nr:hypothetical protein [Chitinispirillia bacterium]MCL2240921.1 hypothetical protein [Chitinispirillia bacterium]